MAPTTMRAIKIVEAGKAEIQEVPLPKLRDDYVLVKVTAVALNPTDWKHVDRLATPGCTVGCDYAGTVVSVGPAVTKSWKAGDRISGFTHGANAVQPEDGCFAEYCVAKGDVQMATPDNTSDEEAATFGVGVVTCGQGLYQSLGLPLPGSGSVGVPLLVYGASTATGSLAVQYGVLSGCSVIAVCSEKNFAFVKSLGASAAFDYKDPDCGKKIREHTNDNLQYAFDCISEGASPGICCAAISSRGGAVSYLLPVKDAHNRSDVTNKYTLGYTVMGESFTLRGDHPAKPEDFEFGRMFEVLSAKLVEGKQLRAHTPKVGKGGLKGVFDGLDDLRHGQVSGVKLVYRVGETA